VTGGSDRAGVTADPEPRTGGTVQPARDAPEPRTGGVREPARVVDARGRAKVFRPLPSDARGAAVARGLAAYARGEFYLAHEELEPAWMAATDPGERELLAGLIKLAAAFVHAARGNPAGVTTSLRGARVRLAGARADGVEGGLDLAALLSAIDERLALVAAMPSPPADTPGTLPDPPHDVAGPPGRARRPPLALVPPALSRSLPA
jgi:hypothetical protein